MGRDDAQTPTVLPILWKSERDQRSLISTIKVNLSISVIVQWIDLVK